MPMIRFTLACLLLGCLSLAAQGEDMESQFNLMADGEAALRNPYVELYFQRLQMAKLAVEAQQIQVEHDLKILKMYTALMESKVISRESFLDITLKSNLSEANLKELKASVIEADSLYQLSIARTQAGLEMPICSK